LKSYGIFLKISKGICICRLCICPGKARKGPNYSPLVYPDVLSRQRWLRQSCKTHARIRKVYSIYTKDLSKSRDTYRFKALKPLGQEQWLTSVIPAIQEAEVRGWMFRANQSKRFKRFHINQQTRCAGACLLSQLHGRHKWENLESQSKSRLEEAKKKKVVTYYKNS
jgi:hypothetical protein